MRGRLDQLKKCLVGWWGLNSAPFPELEYVRSWATQHWALKRNLRIDRLGRGFLLFEFESSSEAERVLAKGLRNIKENVIILDRWNPEVGCHCKDSGAKEVWVRVVGLPLHLWRSEVFERIGDRCGGFVAVDEKSLYSPELQWARILVKCVDKEFPSTTHIVVGSGCYSLQLWWESSPWFTQVVQAEGFGGEDGPRKGEDDGGTSHALHYGSQREKVEQVRLQQGVLDVSSSGSVPSFFHAVASDAGTVAEGRVGTGDGRVNGGKELSFKRMEDSAFGPKDPGFGPSRLVKGVSQGPLKENGEPLGPFKEIQKRLDGREGEKGVGIGLEGYGSRPIDSFVTMDCRPIVSFDAMGCREGENGSGPGLEGLVVEDGGTLFGEGPSASLPMAQMLCLERGVNGEPNPFALGEDPSADCIRA